MSLVGNERTDSSTVPWDDIKWVRANEIPELLNKDGKLELYSFNED